MISSTDICRRKHGGVATSKEANGKVRKWRDRELILAAVRRAGKDGLTCRELAESWGVGMNCVSGRFTELAEKGFIKRSGERRGDCYVWIEGGAA